jgi:spore coat polysaccharide biosynthesis protein SpsF (cytidylyltransferase family)
VCYHLTLPTPVGRWLSSNLEPDILDSGYPGGLGAEVYDGWFMHWLCQNVEDLDLREHPHKWAMSQGFVRTCRCPDSVRAPSERFDVNTLADFDYVSTIYRHLYPSNPRFTAAQLIDLTKRIPRPGTRALI